MKVISLPYNKTAIFSSLKVSGIFTSNNTSNVIRPLDISGLNVVIVLNSFGADITNLNISVIEKQNTINWILNLI